MSRLAHQIGDLVLCPLVESRSGDRDLCLASSSSSEDRKIEFQRCLQNDDLNCGSGLASNFHDYRIALCLFLDHNRGAQKSLQHFDMCFGMIGQSHRAK
ncbi:MAG: hypothetical protein JWP89_160 [Schlesneria sp.]|nr:hypothetical protein [Schlesneria sp.]